MVCIIFLTSLNTLLLHTKLRVLFTCLLQNIAEEFIEIYTLQQLT